MPFPYFRRKKRKAMQKNLLQDGISVKYNRADVENRNKNNNDDNGSNGNRNGNNDYINKNINENEHEHENENCRGSGNNDGVNNSINNTNLNNKKINNQTISNSINYWNSESKGNRSKFSDILPETQDLDRFLTEEDVVEVEVEESDGRGIEYDNAKNVNQKIGKKCTENGIFPSTKKSTKYDYLESDNIEEEDSSISNDKYIDIDNDENKNRSGNIADNRKQDNHTKFFQKPYSIGIFPETVPLFTDLNISVENSEENVSQKPLKSFKLNAYETKERNGIFPLFNSMSQYDEEGNYFIEKQRPRWWRENDKEHSSSILPVKEYSAHENVIRSLHKRSNSNTDRNGSFYNEPSSKPNNISTSKNFLDEFDFHENTNDNEIRKNDENQIGKRRFVKPLYSIMDTQSQNHNGRGLWPDSGTY